MPAPSPSDPATPPPPPAPAPALAPNRAARRGAAGKRRQSSATLPGFGGHARSAQGRRVNPIRRTG